MKVAKWEAIRMHPASDWSIVRIYACFLRLIGPSSPVCAYQVAKWEVIRDVGTTGRPSRDDVRTLIDRIMAVIQGTEKDQTKVEEQELLQF
eukprot:692902-Prorocentrum_minimum.AAC.1